MTRPTHSERLAIREQQRAHRLTWRSRQPKSEPVTCPVCKTAKARVVRTWGNNAGCGHVGDTGTCSQACEDALRQRKAGAA